MGSKQGQQAAARRLRAAHDDDFIKENCQRSLVPLFSTVFAPSM